MDDIKQIADNAFAYNSPGRGLYANPEVLAAANTLLQVRSGDRGRLGGPGRKGETEDNQGREEDWEESLCGGS